MGKALKKRQEHAQALREHTDKWLKKSSYQPPPVEVPPITWISSAYPTIRPVSGFTSRLKSRDHHKQIAEAVKYCFNKYPTPNFLMKVWYVKPTVLSAARMRFVINSRGFNIDNFRDWYITLATGGSLYKQHFSSFFTKKETHFFSTCPFDCEVSEAAWYAVICAQGFPPHQAIKLAQTRLAEREISAWWKAAARWFAHHAISLSKSEINDLLDYVRAKHGESKEWYLKDLTLQNLQKRTKSWHRELHRSSTLSGRYPKWEGLPIDDIVLERVVNGKVIKWKFHQITTGKELASEGNKQRHCVSSYAPRCANGEISIWSLTRWEELGGWHALTIEVRNSTKQIVQARGIANRSATAAEKSVLQEWCVKTGFRIAHLY
jgi:hypothetical protein